MSTLALIFPGQGSQTVGMGSDISDHFPEAEVFFDRANEILGYDLKKLCFFGPESELKKTENTQPAIFTMSACIVEILKSKNIQFDLTAGHSLGEYSAYYAAGYYSFEEGLKAVRKRGLLMADADKEGRGAMSAIIGLDDEKVIEICDTASEKGIVVPANFNSKGQVVISGEKNAVEEAGRIAEEEYATVIPLAVSGGFHSPLMEPVAKELEKYLANNITINSSTNTRVISNVYAEEVSTDKIIQSLVKQLTSPVRWKNTIEKMIESGVETFIEAGPKKVLTNMMKRINKKVARFPTENVEALNKAMETIS